MPRIKWNWDEIKTSVELRHTGKSWEYIAQKMTEQNLRDAFKDSPETLAALLQIIKEETQINLILKACWKRSIPGIKDRQDDIREAIVTRQRLFHLSKREEWKAYQQEYQRAYIESEVRK